MGGGIRTLLEAFGHILFSFTKGVSEQYNPEELKNTPEPLGYNPLESTGQEWYLHGDPDDECINQEYINGEATSLDHQTRRLNSLEIMPPDTSSMEENDETQEYSEDENEE